MILGCIQPSYLAWIPFFKRMQISDFFVYLDDVEFSKNSFHNRNYIKTATGSITLTVPVLYKGHSKDHICNIKINSNTNWAKRHWHSIEMNYHKAKYFQDLKTSIYSIYFQKWVTLGDLNIALIELFREYLGINIPTYRSSEMSIDSTGNAKLVEMCKKLGASKFIVKPGTEHYHPQSYFEASGISLTTFSFEAKEYPQLYGGFVPGLSILDYAMNCGPDCSYL